jgi:transcriptional regulator with XRE-family HTH domain
MITAGQLRAARALIGLDQRALADHAGVSVQTIQRMEASDNFVRGVVDSLVKVVETLDRLGIELIGEAATSSTGSRGVRLKTVDSHSYKVRDAAAATPNRRQPLKGSPRRTRIDG